MIDYVFCDSKFLLFIKSLIAGLEGIKLTVTLIFPPRGYPLPQSPPQL